ncbi:5'-3' exoribonuclease 2 [Pelomyxa schiedti]|nr:5'-3' exoribonuclease 2 [Pelomyxa schiedti]
MGIPAFFRWLSQKFPKITVAATAGEPERGSSAHHTHTTDGGITFNSDGVVVGGGPAPINTAEANPNGVEFDNLYLDMNGIVHPCCHPEGAPAPATEEEMLAAVFEYVDYLFAIVRPRRLLYMAVDGVAPRAKINQQRSRRFRSAQEAAEKLSKAEALRNKLISQGREAFEEPVKSWDSNVITPGTPFMAKLSRSLRYYITQHLNNDPGWRGIKVVLSDSSVPGEGEHKIMEYIRKQRNKPGYPPNMRHCLYGLDADLIMLSLATHEAHFSLVREVVFNSVSDSKCFVCGQPGHIAAQCPGKDASSAGSCIQKKPFQFLHCNVLREYLENTLGDVQTRFEVNIERLIDDWVFVCFMVGNDFLPHLPTLDIREGAIETLTNLYKTVLTKLDGYLTDSGTVIIPNAMIFIEEIAKLEDGILVKRRENERRQQARYNNNYRNSPQSPRSPPPLLPFQQPTDNSQYSTAVSSSPEQPLAGNVQPMNLQTQRGMQDLDSLNFGAARSIKGSLFSSSSPFPIRSPRTPRDGNSFDQPQDEIRLGDFGWRERYYKVKFNKNMDDTEFFTQLCGSYMTGLCWVLKYYYQGCCSWKWFYPYHYSPFAGEIAKFVDRNTFSPVFELGEPFRPFEQLMGVLPAASAHCLPACYASLMSDPKSPIIDFYPLDFAVDSDGKKAAWLGVVLLPFIDEERLVQTLGMFENQLSEEERYRNRRYGNDVLYSHKSHPVAETAIQMYNAVRSSTSSEQADIFATLEFRLHQITGIIRPYYDPLLNGMPQLPGVTYPRFAQFGNIEESVAVSSLFINPTYEKGKIFISGIPEGCQLPPRELRDVDFLPPDTRGGPRSYFRGQNSPAVRMLNQAVLSRQSKDYRPPLFPATTNVDSAVEESRDRYKSMSRGARFNATEYNRRGQNYHSSHHQPYYDDGYSGSQAQNADRDLTWQQRNMLSSRSEKDRDQTDKEPERDSYRSDQRTPRESNWNPSSPSSPNSSSYQPNPYPNSMGMGFNPPQSREYYSQYSPNATQPQPQQGYYNSSPYSSLYSGNVNQPQQTGSLAQQPMPPPQHPGPQSQQPYMPRSQPQSPYLSTQQPYSPHFSPRMESQPAVPSAPAMPLPQQGTSSYPPYGSSNWGGSPSYTSYGGYQPPTSYYGPPPSSRMPPPSSVPTNLYNPAQPQQPPQQPHKFLYSNTPPPSWLASPSFTQPSQASQQSTQLPTPNPNNANTGTATSNISPNPPAFSQPPAVEQTTTNPTDSARPQHPCQTLYQPPHQRRALLQPPSAFRQQQQPISPAPYIPSYSQQQPQSPQPMQPQMQSQQNRMGTFPPPMSYGKP